MRRSRNPLHKRFKRQLVHNASRYLGILALLVVVVGVVSGLFTTLSSVQAIMDGMDEDNAVEDARFETDEPLSGEARAAVEGVGARVYDNWSRDVDAAVGDVDATVRLYVDRTQIDLASYYAGRAPESDDEVALDATFCAHHGISVGDAVEIGGSTFTVCGIMVLPDYVALMRSNSDFVMDAITFSVGLVSTDGFARFDDRSTS